MNNRTNRKTLLWTALALGLLAELLVWVGRPAVTGFALWVLLLAITITFHGYRYRISSLWHVLPWCACACLCAFLLVLRSYPGYIPLLLLMMMLSTVMVVATRDRADNLSLQTGDLLAAFLHVLCWLATGPTLLLAGTQQAQSNKRPNLGAWLRGLLLALPLLLVFMLLLMEADAGFSLKLEALARTLETEARFLVMRLLLFVWLALGLLGAMLLPLPFTISGPGFKPRLGKEETTALLGSLCLLFGFFTVQQLGYLFGGSETIAATPGLTVATYARRGFFELLAVSALTLVVLMATGHVSEDKQRFRLLAMVLLVCVFIMQGSAMQRLYLYIDNFGLTLARVLTTTLMLWLALVLTWYLLTLWKSQVRGFVYGSISSGMALMLLCLAINPAALVARTNLDRHLHQGHILDTNYLMSLGADAVPTVLARFDALEGMAQCGITLHRLNMSVGLQEHSRDWRHFSWSRWRAREATSEHRKKLEAQRLTPVNCRFSP
jgi:hypothetical protein